MHRRQDDLEPDAKSPIQNRLRSLAALSRLDNLSVLDSLFAAIPDGLVLTTPASEIVWANRSYCAMTGYQFEELVGRTPRVLRSGQTPPTAIRALWDSLVSCGFFHGRIVNRRSDGRRFHADLSISRLDGEPTYFLGVMRDVTADVELERTLDELRRRADAARDTTITALASLAEQRDDCTGAHLERVEQFCRCMATATLLHHPELLPPWARSADLIARCSVLHDIGKVGVPDAILTKPGRLTPEEQVEMRRHPVIGASIIERLLELQPESEFLRVAYDIVLCHHERFDGRGYPQGISGDAIPMVAQLTTIADVLDALTTRRPYKPAHSFESACTWLESQSGTAFHPLVVESLIRSRVDLGKIHARHVTESPSSDPIAPSGMSLPALGSTHPSRPPICTEVKARPGAELLDLLRNTESQLGTGEIVVRHGSLVSRLYLRAGRIAWIHTTANRLPLPQVLISEHHVPVDVVREVVDECKRSGRPFGDELLEHGALDEAALGQIIQRHLASKLSALTSIVSPVVAFVARPTVKGGRFSFSLAELL